MPMWLQITIGVATGMAAMSVVWWRIIVPVARLSDATPILVEIAAQFRPNDGHSLHDRIVRIEQTLTELQRSIERIVVDQGGRVGPDDIDGTPI